MGGGSARRKDDNPSQFKGPVLFVNHGVGNLTSSPHRHEVFTHVQNNYRRWRRREDARSIRAGVRLPTTISVGGRSLTSQSSQPPRGFISSSSSGGLDYDEAREARRRANLENALQLSNSPISFLRNGNSDPFSAYKFKVDPQANELIAFYRDYIVPCMYHTSSDRKALTSASAKRDFDDIVAGLKDEGGAYGFLARNAFVAARSNPAMRKAAAVYGDKSVKLLMKKVAAGEELQDQQTYWHVNNLWAAETIDGNLAGAIAHGKMIRYLFEQQAKKGKVDIKFLIYVIYTDCQMSAMFLVPPAFDVDNWLPQVLGPVSKMAAAAAAANLAPLSEEVNRLDSSVDDPKLREIFISRRESLEHFVSSASQEREVEHSQLILAWILFRAVIAQGKMINYYLKKSRDLVESNAAEEAIDRLYAQIYLALAAIYIARLWSFNNAVLGTPMFDANPNIAAKLRETLEASDRLPGGPTFHQYNHARLWAFYVGAFGEQQDFDFGRSKDDPSKQWFNRKLAEQSYITNVKTWERAKNVFKGFLHTDLLPPNGSTWFSKTLEINRSLNPYA